MQMQTVCGTTFIVDDMHYEELFRHHSWRLDENGEVVTTIERAPGRTGVLYAAHAVQSLPNAERGEVGYLNGDKLDLRSENLFEV